LGEKPVGRKTFRRIIFWATYDWATTVISKKTFHRKTVGRQRHMQFAFLLASINSTSSAMTHWMQSFNASFQHGILRCTRLIVGSQLWNKISTITYWF